MDNNIHEVGFGNSTLTQIEQLYQYDKGQILKITDKVEDGTEVQFSNNNSEITINKAINDSQVEIPDILLQENKKILAYLKIINSDSETTIKTVIIPVKARTKPADYIEPEQEKPFRKYVEEKLENAEKLVAEANDKVKVNEECLKQIDIKTEQSVNQIAEVTNAKMGDLANTTNQQLENINTTAVSQIKAINSSAAAAGESQTKGINTVALSQIDAINKTAQAQSSALSKQAERIMINLGIKARKIDGITCTTTDDLEISSQYKFISFGYITYGNGYSQLLPFMPLSVTLYKVKNGEVIESFKNISSNTYYDVSDCDAIRLDTAYQGGSGVKFSLDYALSRY